MATLGSAAAVTTTGTSITGSLSAGGVRCWTRRAGTPASGSPPSRCPTGSAAAATCGTCAAGSRRSRARLPLLAEHVVVRGDRLDLIAAAYLGDPTQFWRICDANPVIHPEELCCGRPDRASRSGSRSRRREADAMALLQHDAHPADRPDRRGAGAAAAARRAGPRRGHHLRHAAGPASSSSSPPGRSGLRGPASTTPLLSQPTLRPFSRVMLLVTFGGPPQVLMDGVITHRELMPGHHARAPARSPSPARTSA